MVVRFFGPSSSTCCPKVAPLLRSQRLVGRSRSSSSSSACMDESVELEAGALLTLLRHLLKQHGDRFEPINRHSPIIVRPRSSASYSLREFRRAEVKAHVARSVHADPVRRRPSPRPLHVCCSARFESRSAQFRRRFQLIKTALSRSSADLALRSRSLLSLDPPRVLLLLLPATRCPRLPAA